MGVRKYGGMKKKWDIMRGKSSDRSVCQFQGVNTLTVQATNDLSPMCVMLKYLTTGAQKLLTTGFSTTQKMGDVG